MTSSIGQQVIIERFGEIGPRIVLTIYSSDEQTGYIMREGKRVPVVRLNKSDAFPQATNAEKQGFVDDRQLKQLWQVAEEE